MKTLTQTLQDNPFSLMVSLPQNSPQMARVALDEGAQILKVHLYCQHFASGTNFGNWNQEKEAILEIAELCHKAQVPLGLVTGEEEQPSDLDWQELLQSSISFWDLFAHYASPQQFDRAQGWQSMVAVGPDFDPPLLKALELMGVDVIESSIIPRTSYHTPLHLGDLGHYRRLRESTSLPILIPTQKQVQPEELHSLQAIGANGITIGAVVTGLEVDSLAQATRHFAQAIQKR